MDIIDNFSTLEKQVRDILRYLSVKYKHTDLSTALAENWYIFTRADSNGLYALLNDPKNSKNIAHVRISKNELLKYYKYITDNLPEKTSPYVADGKKLPIIEIKKSADPMQKLSDKAKELLGMNDNANDNANDNDNDKSEEKITAEDIWKFSRFIVVKIYDYISEGINTTSPEILFNYTQKDWLNFLKNLKEGKHYQNDNFITDIAADLVSDSMNIKVTDKIMVKLTAGQLKELVKETINIFTEDMRDTISYIYEEIEYRLESNE